MSEKSQIVLRVLWAVVALQLTVFSRGEIRPEITTHSINYRPLPTTGSLSAVQIGSGVWWQPELDETSISQTMQDLQRWGFRNVYVNAFSSGRTLHPSPTFPSHTPPGADWLETVIEEAHAHDLRVIAWVHTLAWWSNEDDASGTTHPLLTHNPHWLDLTADGTTTTGEEGLLYVSPACPDVRDALTTLVHELCGYEIDGINFDYLRYNTSDDFGYHPDAVDAFEAQTGLNASLLEPDTDDHAKWVLYREDVLTSLVEQLSSQVRAIGEEQGKRLLVTAAFTPGYRETRGMNRSYEHWLRWVARGYLDASTPLCFAGSPSALERELREVRSAHQGSTVACLPGLALSPRHPGYLNQRRLLENVGFLHCTISTYETLQAQMLRLESLQNAALEVEDVPTTPAKRGLRNWIRRKLNRW